ncbi:MAG: energy-coupling factor transporter transmembrane component T [Peptostreptococcaceae bacterium]
MSEMLSYIKKDSFIHRLSGSTKLICFLLFSLASMITYDTRVLLLMLFVGMISFKISKIEFKEIAIVLYFILFFLMINSFIIFLFSPLEGTKIYDSETVLFTLFGPYKVTSEQLFYQLNVILKYLATIPIALLFMLTTEPSEFASSLNKIGVNYKAAYSVSIALRYIPDIQRDYKDIAFAQQARGIDMSKDEKILVRLKNASSILTPLIFSSLERIDKVSLAMELRAFGNGKNRTWYNQRNLTKEDYVAIVMFALLVVLSIVMLNINGSRFYNPFI